MARLTPECTAYQAVIVWPPTKEIGKKPDGHRLVRVLRRIVLETLPRSPGQMNVTGIGVYHPGHGRSAPHLHVLCPGGVPFRGSLALEGGARITAWERTPDWDQAIDWFVRFASPVGAFRASPRRAR